MATRQQKRITLEELRQRQRRRTRAFSLLAVMVVLGTAIALMMPAISMTADVAESDPGIALVSTQATGDVHDLEDPESSDAVDADAADDTESAHDQAPSQSAASHEDAAAAAEHESAAADDVDEPAAQEPAAADEPAEPATDDPAAQEPAADEPAATDEPAAEAELDADDPFDAELEEVNDEPLADDGTVKKLSLTYEDDDLKVVALARDNAGIPADAELVVTPITARTKGYNYEAYMDALRAESANAEYDDTNTLLFDVAIMVGQVEFEPADGTVALSFEFKGNQLSEQIGAEDASGISVVHLPLVDSVRERYDATKGATNFQSSDVEPEPVEAKATLDANGDETLKFTLESLSTIAITNSNTTLEIDSQMPAGNVYYACVTGPNGYKKMVKLSNDGITSVQLASSGSYEVKVYTPKKDKTEQSIDNNINNNQVDSIIQNDVIELVPGAMQTGGYLLSMSGVTEQGNKASMSISLDLPTPGISVDFSSLMDHAAAYGVVAETFQSGAQVRTNFATKVLDMLNQSEGQFGIRINSDDPIPFIAGEIQTTSSGQLFNAEHSADYYVTADDLAKIQTASTDQIGIMRDKDELNDKVDVMITRTLNQAKTLSDKSKTDYNMATLAELGSLPTDQRIVDVTAYPDNATIVLDATNLAKTNCMDMTIRKKPGQTIVFNMYGDTVNMPSQYNLVNVEFDANGSVISEKSYNLGNNGRDTMNDDFENKEELSPVAGDAWKKIIWNVPDATKINEPSGSVAGVFLIQSGADFTTNNGGGWIVSSGHVKNKNHWYAFPATDEPFAQLEVEKVFRGVDKVADIDPNYYLQLQTYANAQSSGTTTAKNEVRFVLKPAGSTGSSTDIGYAAPPTEDSANHTVTVKWLSDWLAVGNEHKIYEVNAQAKPFGSNTMADPANVTFETRTIVIDNTVFPHTVTWRNNPLKSATELDGNVNGLVGDAYGILNIGNNTVNGAHNPNNVVKVTNDYAKKDKVNLSVSKDVAGAEPEPAPEYQFVVTLTDQNGNAPTTQATYKFEKVSSAGATHEAELTFANDQGTYKAEFTLSKGQTITINDLPVDYRYTVQEKPGNGYVATYNGKTAENASGTLDWDKSVQVTNTYPASTSIEATKVLQKSTGEAQELRAGRFEFMLTQVDANGEVVDDGTTATVTNGVGEDNARILFENAAVFTADDFADGATEATKYYTIVENAGSEAGMTYASNTVFVSVKAHKAADGAITVDAPVYSDFNDAPEGELTAEWIPESDNKLRGQLIIDISGVASDSNDVKVTDDDDKSGSPYQTYSVDSNHVATNLVLNDKTGDQSFTVKAGGHEAKVVIATTESVAGSEGSGASQGPSISYTLTPVDYENKWEGGEIVGKEARSWKASVTVTIPDAKQGKWYVLYRPRSSSYDNTNKDGGERIGSGQCAANGAFTFSGEAMFYGYDAWNNGFAKVWVAESNEQWSGTITPLAESDLPRCGNDSISGSSGGGTPAVEPVAATSTLKSVTDSYTPADYSPVFVNTTDVEDQVKTVNLTIVKVDQSGKALEGAAFTFGGGDIEQASYTSAKGTGADAIIYQNAALPVGTYTLTETAAPDGYEALSGSYTIAVTEDAADGATVAVTVNGAALDNNRLTHDTATDTWRLEVVNTSGVELPHTGGSGTLPITLAGTLMIALAATYLLRRRAL